jgi:hypothetical protein
LEGPRAARPKASIEHIVPVVPESQPRTSIG